MPGCRNRPGHRLRHQAGTGHSYVARFLDAGHQAAWFAGDEVYGGNPKLRTALEERDTGYVLAVACSHEVTTGAGRFRADTVTKKATVSTAGQSKTSPTPDPGVVSC